MGRSIKKPKAKTLFVVKFKKGLKVGPIEEVSWPKGTTVERREVKF